MTPTERARSKAANWSGKKMEMLTVQGAAQAITEAVAENDKAWKHTLECGIKVEREACKLLAIEVEGKGGTALHVVAALRARGGDEPDFKRGDLGSYRPW